MHILRCVIWQPFIYATYPYVLNRNKLPNVLFVLLLVGFTQIKHCCFILCALTAHFHLYPSNTFVPKDDHIVYKHAYMLYTFDGLLFSVALSVRYLLSYLPMLETSSCMVPCLLGVRTFLLSIRSSRSNEVS